MVTPSQLKVLITAIGTPSQFILHAFEKGVLKIPNCLRPIFQNLFLKIYFFPIRKYYFRKYKERERIKDENSDLEFKELMNYTQRLENILESQNKVCTYIFFSSL